MALATIAGLPGAGAASAIAAQKIAPTTTRRPDLPPWLGNVTKPLDWLGEQLAPGISPLTEALAPGWDVLKSVLGGGGVTPTTVPQEVGGVGAVPTGPRGGAMGPWGLLSDWLGDIPGRLEGWGGGVPTPTPEEEHKVGDYYIDEGWMWQWQLDDWGNLIPVPLYRIEQPPPAAGGMTEYERAYLDYLGQQQEAERRQWLSELAANPRSWIQYALATTGQPGTTPSWLSQIYEGQVPTGAPLGEAKEMGYFPALSKQWYDWLNPSEREMMKGYQSWLGIAPEDWMSNLWWMRGQQPYGMGRQFAPYRQYG